MTKRGEQGRYSGTRGKDEAVAQAVAAESVAGAWSALRSRYSPAIQSLVDGVLERGGLSLADLAALELAEHERIGEELEQLDTQAKTSTAIASLRSVRMASRKHMRTLRLLTNPVATADTARSKVPSKVAERYRQRGHEVDGGDSLLAAPTTQLEA